MDNLRYEQLEVIKSSLRGIYKANNLTVSPYSIDIQAEALLERLYECELEEKNRWMVLEELKAHEMSLETREKHD